MLGTKYPELFAALSAEFGPEVRTRPQGNRQLPYITARTVMNRLDAIVGPENWWDEYTPLQNGVLCKLTIRLPEGEVICKSDAGGHAGMSDEGDDEKSAYSDSFKRAAVKFGIGRHLYGEGSPIAAQANDRPQKSRAPKKATAPPVATTPGVDPKPSPQSPTAPTVPASVAGGKGLLEWIRRQDPDRTGLADRMTKAMAKWGIEKRYGGAIREWNRSQAIEAYRWIQTQMELESTSA